MSVMLQRQRVTFSLVYQSQRVSVMKNKVWLHTSGILLIISAALATDANAARIYNKHYQPLQVCGHGAFNLFGGAGSECITIPGGERSRSLDWGFSSIGGSDERRYSWSCDMGSAWLRGGNYAVLHGCPTIGANFPQYVEFNVDGNTHFCHQETYKDFFTGNTYRKEVWGRSPPSVCSSYGFDEIDEEPEEDTDFKVAIEAPADGGVVSGVSVVRGWAIASSGIEIVEMFVNGRYHSDIPIGGKRIDIKDAHPAVTDSLRSGFSSPAFNFNSLGSGEHTISIRATSSNGYQLIEETAFRVEPLSIETIQEGEYPSLEAANVAVSGEQELTVSGIELQGGRLRNARLQWSPAVQGFEIASVTSIEGELQVFTELEANNSESTANSFTTPARLSGQLSDVDDVDWYSVTTNKANQKLEISFYTDSQDGDGQWLVKWVGPSCKTHMNISLSQRIFRSVDGISSYLIDACDPGTYAVGIGAYKDFYFDDDDYNIEVTAYDK